MRHREPAICVRVSDWSETSQVAEFFTRGQGIARVLAKGSKRPKSKTGGRIDLLAEGDLVWSGAGREGLGTLMEFTESASHNALRRDRPRLNAALYMLELVAAAMAENDPHPESFDLLHKALARLAEQDAPAGAVLAYFQWRLLKQIGLLGDLTRCVRCGTELAGRPAGWSFCSREGGLVCRGCAVPGEPRRPLDAAAPAALAALAAAEAGRKAFLPEAQARAANALLAYHVREQLGRPMRMARYVLGTGA